MKIKNILELAKNYLSPGSKIEDNRNFESILEGLAERGEDPDEEMIGKSKEKVLVRIRKKRRKKSNFRSIIVASGKYVAGLGIIGLLSWGFFHIQNSSPEAPPLLVKETGSGMRSTIHLGDGSMVRMNENSRLEFPEFFGPGERTVKLYGEAFFDINSDSDNPFKVVSDQSEVTVLGTAFNINTFRNTEITVASGKVQVADTHTNEEVLLTRGQQAILNEDAIQVKEVNPDYFMGWHTRKLNFEDEPIEKVFDILERAYGVKINIRSDKSRENCLITGFYEGERIETIFKGLTNLIDFEYDTDRATKTITIDLKRCKQ